MAVKDALRFPPTDVTPIFDLFRGNFATELLAASVAHLHVFDILNERPLSLDELQSRLVLSERATQVLVTGLCAMQLLTKRLAGEIDLTPLSRNHLVSTSPFSVGGYISLAAQSAGTLALVERLKSDRPEGAESAQGAAFIFREGSESAMDREDSARFLTLSLAGRAWNVAPRFADVLPAGQPGKVLKDNSANGGRVLLDVAGGSGIYTMAVLQKYPTWRGIIFDRPEVLKIAAELAEQTGVRDRLELHAGDMWVDPFPPADDILLSNVLHDWDRPQCARLVAKATSGLPEGGRLLIQDVLLNSDLTGPLEIALYSLALFSLTEGRAYSLEEYRGWIAGADLKYVDCIPTSAHGHLILSEKV